MRAALRPVLVVVGATTLLVPSGAGPAAAAALEERRDTWHPENATCQVASRHETWEETITISTVSGSHPDDPGNDTACYWGAIEARVRYTYRDADGDLQSGEAAAPRSVVLSLPSAGVTELRTWHQVTYYDGTTTPEYPLPK